MRASRLLSILTTLQARGRATAAELAAACEVSLRTIYRDVDALSAAGIPIYSERGAEGGYRLVDGYRTRLNGFSAKEAETLFLVGLNGPAADLGLSAELSAAQLKLRAALPADQRAGADRIASRFHLDLPKWFEVAEQPVHLAAIAEAVWAQKVICVRYQSWETESERRIEPLGIVLKGGAWYLVGQRDSQPPRTYRIARVRDLQVQDEKFERPQAFDLVAYWRDSLRRMDVELHPLQATLRLSPWALCMLDTFVSAYARATAQISEVADTNGWLTVTLALGPLNYAASDLLRFGAEIEVLAPPELRARVMEKAAELHDLYAIKYSQKISGQ